MSPKDGPAGWQMELHLTTQASEDAGGSGCEHLGSWTDYWMASLECIGSWLLNSVTSSPRDSRAGTPSVASSPGGSQGCRWTWGFSLLFLRWGRLSTAWFPFLGPFID